MKISACTRKHTQTENYYIRYSPERAVTIDENLLLYKWRLVGYNAFHKRQPDSAGCAKYIPLNTARFGCLRTIHTTKYSQIWLLAYNTHH
jgi:hypothetical protein